jgi:integrase
MGVGSLVAVREVTCPKCRRRDLRHTFVSLASADGIPIEEIARLAGHNRTATTELVYRHELRPVITTGAEVMDRILKLRG